MTDPLVVDVFPRAALGLEGRLGMTMMPGRIDPRPREAGGGHFRDLDADLQRIRKVYDCRILVSHLERFEYILLQHKYEEFRAAARKYQIRLIHYPIIDNRTPKDPQSYLELIADIATQLAVSRNVIVHCRAGHGRTGLTAACVLVYMGMDPLKAIEWVRRTRNDALTRGTQVRFVQDFPDLMAGLYLGD